MAIEHVDILDPDIHEPKGVASALLGDVYTADGFSSGDWKKITPNNLVMVHTASDFPSATAGVRTLAADTVYHIVGQVDVGSDRFVVSNNTVVRGTNQDLDEIVTSNAGVMFTQTDVNARWIQIKLTTVGTLFDIDGTGVESSDWIRVAAVCATIGDIDNMNVVDLFRGDIVASLAGLTFTGVLGTVDIEDFNISVAATNATVIDLQTATLSGFNLIHCGIGNPTGTGYGVDVAPAGANFGASDFGVMEDLTFNLTANASNYVEGDAGWFVSLAPGVPSSAAKAQGSVVVNVAANTFGGGVGVPEAANFGVAFVADTEHSFTISTAGRFTFNGLVETSFLVEADMFVTMGGGAARNRRFYIAKNGTVISSSVARRQFDGTNPGSLTCSSIVSLSPTDYIEVYIEAETATTSTIIDTASIKIIKGV